MATPPDPRTEDIQREMQAEATRIEALLEAARRAREDLLEEIRRLEAALDDRDQGEG